MKKYILRYSHWYSRYILWKLNEKGEYNELCSSWLGSYDFETVLSKEDAQEYIVKITDSLLDIIEPGDMVKTIKSQKPFIWDGVRKLNEKNITHIWKRFSDEYRITFKQKSGGIYRIPSPRPTWMWREEMGVEQPKPKKYRWED